MQGTDVANFVDSIVNHGGRVGVGATATLWVV